jgi:ketosteroid isomerase-like protein
MTTTITLPQTIATYFDADRTNDIETLIDCFAPDARVHDEQEDHVGHEAIRAWKVAASQKYQYTVTPLAVRQNGDEVIVHNRLEGTFPGSPVEVDHIFGLRDNRITSLRVE